MNLIMNKTRNQSNSVNVDKLMYIYMNERTLNRPRELKRRLRFADRDRILQEETGYPQNWCTWHIINKHLLLINYPWPYLVFESKFQHTSREISDPADFAGDRSSSALSFDLQLCDNIPNTHQRLKWIYITGEVRVLFLPDKASGIRLCRWDSCFAIPCSIAWVGETRWTLSRNNHQRRATYAWAHRLKLQPYTGIW